VTAPPRVAVVGHVEQIEFAVVERLPGHGEVVHATHWFSAAGGGGAVAAVQLRRLAGEATFLTALGSDGIADQLHRELENHGVTVRAALRPGPHRRGFVHLDTAAGERTITIMGSRILPRGDDPLPWDDLSDYDAVYLTAGDAEAVRRARAARVLVATIRAYDAIREAGVELDVLAASANDATEQHDPGAIDPPPRAIVRTEGEHGGTYTTNEGRTGRWQAHDPPGPAVDAYGCGDAFAAGLTYGLAHGKTLDEALDLGARCGAHCLTGRGPYAAQLSDPGQPESARRSAS
jgi:ribokinase